MDQVTQWRAVLKELFQEYARLYNLSPAEGVETLLVIDEARDQYLLLSTGWSRQRRVRRIPLHVRLHGGKIWVEEDWTEEGIATALVRAGVPRDHIVLAFHPPEKRDLTEFAVA
jgi:hypothetical protein